MIKKLIQGSIIGLAAAAVALALWRTGVLDEWEYATWGWRVQHFARPTSYTPSIKIILIDQASLDWAAKENGLSWPWPRSVYVPVLDFCRRSGAKVIAFDMLYSEPGVSVEDDSLFGDAIHRTPNFVGAFFMGQQAEQTSSWPDTIPKPKFPVQDLKAWLTTDRRAVLVEPRATFPIPEVATNASWLASVKDQPDGDGMYRRVTPFRVFDGLAVPALGLAAFLAGGTERWDTDEVLRVENSFFDVGSIHIPLDRMGRAIPYFRGPSGTHPTFSAAAIIQSELRLEEGGEPVIGTNELRDCYVLFGVSAPGLKDLKSTPIAGDYPGVEIHATFLDNLLEQDFMKDAPTTGVIVLTFVMAMLAALSVVLGKKAWHSVLAFIVFLPVPMLGGFMTYVPGYWWPIVGPELAVALALVGAVIVNYATEGRQKRFIKSAFKQYLGETIIDQIIADPSSLKLGGEKRELTMFFSDLEKFSSFSEKLDPPHLIDLLNNYLSDIGQIIMEEGGYLDKFIGDAIVAFWNAPVAQEDHAARALRAALRCQRRLVERQDELSKMAAQMPVRMRIGINTGEVVVGNMGSADRFNYTMLGDAANAASRLEGANKAFGTYTMVADTTWQKSRNTVKGRLLGAIRVVGRKAPMRVYEPMSLGDEALPDWVANYEKGVALCLEKRWPDALAIFESIPHDRASEVYAAKLRLLISKQEEDWDGVWNLTEK